MPEVRDSLSSSTGRTSRHSDLRRILSGRPAAAMDAISPVGLELGDFPKRHLTALQGFFEQVLRPASGTIGPEGPSRDRTPRGETRGRHRGCGLELSRGRRRQPRACLTLASVTPHRPGHSVPQGSTELGVPEVVRVPERGIEVRPRFVP